MENLENPIYIFVNIYKYSERIIPEYSIGIKLVSDLNNENKGIVLGERFYYLKGCTDYTAHLLGIYYAISNITLTNLVNRNFYIISNNDRAIEMMDKYVYKYISNQLSNYDIRSCYIPVTTEGNLESEGLILTIVKLIIIYNIHIRFLNMGLVFESFGRTVNKKSTYARFVNYNKEKIYAGHNCFRYILLYMKVLSRHCYASFNDPYNPKLNILIPYTNKSEITEGIAVLYKQLTK